MDDPRNYGSCINTSPDCQLLSVSIHATHLFIIAFTLHSIRSSIDSPPHNHDVSDTTKDGDDNDRHKGHDTHEANDMADPPIKITKKNDKCSQWMLM